MAIKPSALSGMRFIKQSPQDFASDPMQSIRLNQGAPIEPVPGSGGWQAGGPFAPIGQNLGAMLPGSAPPQVPLPPVAPPATPPPANPFAGMVAGMPQSGWSGGGQQWAQQALDAPYMQGWGQPQRPPGATGPAPAAGGTGATGASYATPGVAPTEVSPEALKSIKGIKKMRKARHFTMSDAAKIAAAAALTYATGGAGAAMAIEMAGAALGDAQSNKAMGVGLKKFTKLKNTYLPQAGFVQRKGNWYDTAGKEITPQQKVQILMDMGVWG